MAVILLSLRGGGFSAVAIFLLHPTSNDGVLHCFYFLFSNLSPPLILWESLGEGIQKPVTERVPVTSKV
jgi:hypothetical protein